MAESTIFVSTTCLAPEEPLSARILRYAEAGISDVELGNLVSVKNGELMDLDIQKNTFLVHNYFPPPVEPFVMNLASGSTRIRNRSIQFALEAMDLCSRLKCRCYSVHSGFVTDPVDIGAFGFRFDEPKGEHERIAAWERFLASLKTLVGHVRGSGTSLLIENQPCTSEQSRNILMRSADEVDRLFEEVCSPDLGLLLDVGHLNISARTLGFDPMEFAGSVSRHIKAFHVHWNHGESDSHLPLCDGNWAVDMLRRREFLGAGMTVEAKFRTVRELSDHVEWLRQVTGRV